MTLTLTIIVAGLAAALVTGGVLSTVGVITVKKLINQNKGIKLKN